MQLFLDWQERAKQGAAGVASISAHSPESSVRLAHTD